MSTIGGIWQIVKDLWQAARPLPHPPKLPRIRESELGWKVDDDKTPDERHRKP